MANCKTCGAPVNLAPDGDPKYEAPRATRTPPEGYVLVRVEKFKAAEKLLSAGMSGAISAETAMLGIQDMLAAASEKGE